MPVYEYKCHKCGKEFEVTQRITEEPLKRCPADVCEQEVKGEGEITRKISKNVGLVFNGKGFYITDYAHKNGSLSKSSSNGNGSTKTESTPAAIETKTAKPEKKD